MMGAPCSCNVNEIHITGEASHRQWAPDPSSATANEPRLRQSAPVGLRQEASTACDVASVALSRTLISGGQKVAAALAGEFEQRAVMMWDGKAETMWPAQPGGLPCV